MPTAKFRFSTFDLITIALMAALGIAIKPVVVPLAHIITGPLLLPGGVVAGGFYMLWLVLGYGLTGNKPGTALLIGLIQGIVVLLQPFANHGALSLLTYTAPGLAVELLYLFAGGPKDALRSFAGGAAANITGSFLVYLVLMRIQLWNLPLAAVALPFLLATLAGGLGGLVAFGLLEQLRKLQLLQHDR